MKTNWITQKIFQDITIHLKGVVSLTLFNSGKKPLYFREQVVEPGQTYLLEGDGSHSDIDLDIRFENGQGEALLNYRALKQC